MGIKASFFRWWVNAWPHRVRLRKYVPEFLRSSPEPFRGEVLELGAGHGWTSRKILETFPQVELTAVDSDSGAAKAFARLEAKYGRRLKALQADLFKLPFDRESFDIVIGINVFPYLKPYSVRKAVEESLRVLRPGGLLGISDWALLQPSYNVRRKSLEEILREEHCEILKATGASPRALWARKPYPIPPESVTVEE
ncbi:MAG: methyltransferase domain-containing protein [Candidatus Andersenbacteria bacterium]|nr:methyltransferase domain-containing protein [Candidatus Andersenbacteria bacterium]MBI3251164.1 methyltransferase domain-containing protein [Candidatus Andersenbacteria bacterium]